MQKQQAVQQQQTSLDGTVQGYHAICNFDADAAAAAFRRQRGFTALLRNGAGDYTLTLQDAIDLANGDGVVMASLNAAAAGMVAVSVVSATQIRVKTLDSAAMAADSDFNLLIARIGPN